MSGQALIEQENLIEQEIRELGSAFGHDLAAALVLASSRNGDASALKREMAGIVLGQIAAAVRALEDADFPADLTACYERAARRGVRDELLKSRAIAEGMERRAA